MQAQPAKPQEVFSSSCWCCVLPPAVMAGAKRTFLFSLTPEEEQHPAKLVKFCDRVPAVAKTGDKFRDDELEMQRQHFCKLLSGLWRRPELVMQANSWFEGKLESLKHEVAEGFFPKISVVGALDQAWVAHYLVNRLPISMSLLEKACDYDPEAWLQLLCWMLDCSKTLKLPKVCQQMTVMTLAFDKRVASIGRRWLNLEAKDIIDENSGALSWASFGVFEVKFDGEKTRAIEVRHRPTQNVAKIPSHVLIDSTFCLSENWLDFGAKVTKKPASYELFHFFDKATGPFKEESLVGTSKLFNDIAAEAKQELNDGRSSASGLGGSRSSASSSGQHSFKAATKAASRKEAMLKAREALEQKKQDMQNKRKLSLFVLRA